MPNRVTPMPKWAMAVAQTDLGSPVIRRNPVARPVFLKLDLCATSAKDPTINQLMDTYANVAQSINDTETQRVFVEHLITASRGTTSPLIDLTLTTPQATFRYPGDFPDIIQPEYEH